MKQRLFHNGDYETSDSESSCSEWSDTEQTIKTITYQTLLSKYKKLKQKMSMVMKENNLLKTENETIMQAKNKYKEKYKNIKKNMENETIMIQRKEINIEKERKEMEIEKKIIQRKEVNVEQQRKELKKKEKEFKNALMRNEFIGQCCFIEKALKNKVPLWQYQQRCESTKNKNLTLGQTVHWFKSINRFGENNEIYNKLLQLNDIRVKTMHDNYQINDEQYEDAFMIYNALTSDPNCQ